MNSMKRADLVDLDPYRPENPRGMIRMDANENPYPMPPEVRSYIAALIDRLEFNRYPDPMAEGLLEQLAFQTGAAPENIMAGNGSDEIIFYIMTAFGVGRKVIITTPTFSMYGIHARIAGARPVEAPRGEDFSLDVDAVLAKACNGPSIIIICTPNNPTGNAANPADIEKLSSCTNSIVVVDEAYIEFGGESCIKILNKYPNLVVLRTFSKAFGLAGLRTGYMAADREIINEISRIKQPFNLNSFSQAAAMAVLKFRDAFAGQVDLIKKSRDLLERGMQALPGVRVFPSQANFIFFSTAMPALKVHEALKEKGILIRYIPVQGRGEYLRVTVGTGEENTVFLQGMSGILSES